VDLGKKGVYSFSTSPEVPPAWYFLGTKYLGGANCHRESIGLINGRHIFTDIASAADLMAAWLSGS
jgi:hypothetical protein